MIPLQTIMMMIYIAIAIVMSGIGYGFMIPEWNILTIAIINVIIFSGIIFILLNNPIKSSLEKDVQNSLDKYNTYKDDVEYAIQLKSIWEDAVTNLNKYYIKAGSLLIILNIPYYIVLVLVTRTSLNNDMIIMISKIAYLVLGIIWLLFNITNIGGYVFSVIQQFWYLAIIILLIGSWFLYNWTKQNNVK